MKSLMEELQEKLKTQNEAETIKKLSFLYLNEKNKSWQTFIEEIISSDIPASNRPEKLRDVIVLPPETEKIAKELEKNKKKEN